MRWKWWTPMAKPDVQPATMHRSPTRGCPPRLAWPWYKVDREKDPEHDAATR